MFGRSVHADRGERSRHLPGDDLLQEPIGALTHAVTIRRPRQAVWPWLVQMGASRAGWYSYDFIDNGGQPSATRIIPELQRIAVGDVFPALPGVREGFIVLQIEPERSLVLGWPSPDGNLLVTWAFELQDEEAGSTRLVVRARAGRVPGFRHAILAGQDRHRPWALRDAAQTASRNRSPR